MGEQVVLELVQVLVQVVQVVLVQVDLDLVQDMADSATLLRTPLLRSSEAQAADTMPSLIAEEDLLNLVSVVGHLLLRVKGISVRVGVYDLSIQPNDIPQTLTAHRPE